MNRPTHFVSDIHLRQQTTEDERRKQQHFMAFLRHLQGRSEALFVLGDLFDFWFEYGSAVPSVGARVLAELANLRESGTRVAILAGNHDWWIGEKITQEYGLEIHHEALRETIHGKRLYLSHGDVEGHPGGTYARVRRLLRNPLAIGAFRLLHPDVGAWLARRVSHSSRAATARHPAEDLIPDFYEKVVGPLYAQGVDLAIFGHIHCSRIARDAAGTHVILGEWLTMGTYGELSDGAFRMLTWRDPEGKQWPLDADGPYQH